METRSNHVLVGAVVLILLAVLALFTVWLARLNGGSEKQYDIFFKEAVDGAYWDISAAERVGIGRRYVALAREHWGEDDRGLASVRRFLLWHLDFWYRYVPRYPDGRFPKLQERGDPFEPRSELEAVLSRPDPAAHGWIADLLIHGEERAGPIPQLPSEEDPERHRDPIPQG